MHPDEPNLEPEFFFLLIDPGNKIKNLKPIKWLDICDMVN